MGQGVKVQLAFKDPVRLEKIIRTIPKDLGVKVWDYASRAAARHLREEARARVPVRTGQLKKNLTYNKLGQYMYQMGTKAPRRSIVHFVEFGTAPHIIRRRAGRYGAKQTFMHPGAKPKPFLQPALLQGGAAAIQAARREATRRVRQYFRFMRGKYDRGAKWITK